MPTSSCPICSSDKTQSFWHWEKEDVLVRAWAMDTQVNFSICRSCATIFQDPPIESSATGDGWSFAGTEADSAAMSGPHECIDWLQQFAGVATEPGTALEIHTGSPSIHGFLESSGWSVTTVLITDLENSPTVDVPEGGFDLVTCFYALNRVRDPLSVLETVRTWIKPEGGLYMEEHNPLAMPRFGKICLTSENRFVFPYPTMNYIVSRAGFAQKMGEIAASGRGYFTCLDDIPEVEPLTYVTPDLWHNTIHRFQRNFYYAWATGFLRNYLETMASQPDGREKARARLHANPFHMQIIRDVCGSVFLFVQEVSTLNDTITNDWPQTMSRIFTILKEDYLLYDLLQTAEMPAIQTLPALDRFHLNEKLVYTTERDYFEKYFTLEDARQLNQSIIQAGGVVVGNLSSFL